MKREAALGPQSCTAVIRSQMIFRSACPPTAGIADWLISRFLVGICLLAWPARAQIPPAQVVINEIHYRPPNPTKFEEFVELYNPGSTTVNLSGWKLDGAVRYTFVDGTFLDPGAYLAVARDPAAFQARFAFRAFGPWIGQLSHSGERIQVRDSHNLLVDEVDYGVGFPWPTNPAGGGAPSSPGYSLELIHPSLDRNLGGSWRSSLPPGSGRHGNLLGNQ